MLVFRGFRIVAAAKHPIFRIQTYPFLVPDEDWLSQENCYYFRHFYNNSVASFRIFAPYLLRHRPMSVFGLRFLTLSVLVFMLKLPQSYFRF